MDNLSRPLSRRGLARFTRIVLDNLADPHSRTSRERLSTRRRPPPYPAGVDVRRRRRGGTLPPGPRSRPTGFEPCARASSPWTAARSSCTVVGPMSAPRPHFMPAYLPVLTGGAAAWSDVTAVIGTINVQLRDS